MSRFQIVLLFVLFTFLSCERDTKNRNNCPPILSEAKKDSLFLSDYNYWITNAMVRYTLNKSSVTFANFNSIFFKCKFVKRDSINIGNTVVKLIAGWNTPHYFLKTFADSTIYRTTLKGKLHVEDSSLLKGEIRLTDLEFFIKYSFLLEKDTMLKDNLDELILLYAVQSRKFDGRLSKDSKSYFHFNDLVKYDTSILVNKNFDRNKVADYMFNSLPYRTEASYLNVFECPNNPVIPIKIEEKLELLTRENKDIERMKLEAHNDFINGYLDCYDNFKNVYEQYYVNDTNTTIYFSVPDMKFYFIRIEKENELKIFFRAINGDKYPSIKYNGHYYIPRY